MKKILTLIVAAAALLFTSCNKDYNVNLNNDIRVTLEGYVFDSNGKLPLAEVEVSAGDKKATTNEFGFYKIDGLKSGGYSIKVEKAGYFTEIHSSEMILATDYYGDEYQRANPIYIESNNLTIENLEIQIPLIKSDRDANDERYYFQDENEDTGEPKWTEIHSEVEVTINYPSEYVNNKKVVKTTLGKVTLSGLPLSSEVNISIKYADKDFDNNVVYHGDFELDTDDVKIKLPILRLGWYDNSTYIDYGENY